MQLTSRLFGFFFFFVLLLPPLVASADAEEQRVWVHFSGKCGGAAVDVSPHAIRRRARAFSPIASTDSFDTPVCSAFVEAALAATGGRLIGSSRWLNAASIALRPNCNAAAIADSLAALPFVQSVRPVLRSRRGTVPPADDEVATAQKKSLQELSYGSSLEQLTLINVPNAHSAGHNGSGVRVLVLDSGFQATHPALAAAVVASHDFVDDGRGSTPDAMSHGTSTASCIAGFAPGTLVGAAPGAELLLARTEDVFSEYPHEEDLFVLGLEWGETQGADIASASLGYIDWYTWENMTGSSAISRACDTAFDLGMLVVVSAGNEGFYGIGAPADAETVLSVGATTVAGVWATFSSVGPSADLRIKPDVSAQGLSVWVAKVEDTYGRSSGTSFSCPLVAGVCALVMGAHPEWNARMVRNAIVRTASQFSNPDLRLGFGIVDAMAAISFNGTVNGTDCQSFGCGSGSCVSGKCVCNESSYGPSCEFSRVHCTDFCKLSVATCDAEEHCVCMDGQTTSEAGVGCIFGTYVESSAHSHRTSSFSSSPAMSSFFQPISPAGTASLCAVVSLALSLLSLL